MMEKKRINMDLKREEIMKDGMKWEEKSEDKNVSNKTITWNQKMLKIIFAHYYKMVTLLAMVKVWCRSSTQPSTAFSQKRTWHWSPVPFHGPDEHNLTMTEIDTNGERANLQKLDPNKNPGSDRLFPHKLLTN